MNPLDIIKFKGMWDDFPKFPMFLNAVIQDGITEETVIEIQIKKPNGKEFASNLKIAKEDMALFEKMKTMK